MLIKYINEAINLAKYSIIEDDEPFYGEVNELPGVWAQGKTLEECRYNLIEVIEDWLIISIKKDIEIPSLPNNTINIPLTELEYA